jgi:hypothetical protein
MTHTPQHQRTAWDAASKVRASHRDAVERVRARRDLSEAGRRRQLAQLAVATRDRLAQIRADDEQRMADRHARLEADLFRPTDRSPAGQQLALDAATRAAQCKTPAEVQRLLQTALRLDNTTLAAAVARHAVDLADADPAQADNFWPTVHAWADGVAGARETLDELGHIDAEQLDPMSRFSVSEHFRPEAVPELRGVGNLDALAAEADEATDVVPPSAQQQQWNSVTGGTYNDAA